MFFFQNIPKPYGYTLIKTSLSFDYTAWPQIICSRKVWDTSLHPQCLPTPHPILKMSIKEMHVHMTI